VPTDGVIDLQGKRWKGLMKEKVSIKHKKSKLSLSLSLSCENAKLLEALKLQ